MLRRVTCSVVAVLLVGFVGVGSALADDPPPPLLTGEGGTSSAFTPELIPAPGLAIQIQSVCDVAGVSTVEWTGTGTATGPYVGTFTASGTAKIGPQTSLGGVGQPAAPSGPLLSLNFDFTIDSPTGLVEGSIGTPYGNGGTCTSTGFPDATSPTIVTWERVVDALATFVPYDVTVTTASGTTHIYGQLNYARLSEFAWTDRGYLGSYCEPQHAGTTVTCSGQSFAMFISSSWYAPGEVTVALSSPSTQHAERYSTFTATVKDIYGNLIDGIPVVAQIDGANGPNSLYCVRTGGNNPGQCDFYYQGHQAGDDVITVCPDANTDGQPDAGAPCGTATQTWLPAEPPPVLQDDSGTVDSATGGVAISNVFANDTLGDGTPITPSNINYAGLSGQSAGISLGADGAVNVAPGTAPGVYNFSYYVYDGVGYYSASLQVTVTSSNSDSDNDGVIDSIGTGNGGFSDGGGTSGTVVQPVPAGTTVTVSDALAPNGVDIVVGGTGQATFTLCGWPFPITMGAGSHAILTCGSVKAQVLAGSVVIPLGPNARVTVPANATAEVSQNANGGFQVSNVSGTGVTVTNGSTTTPIQPGAPVSLDVTAPDVVATISGTLGSNGWYRSNVTVTWTVSDGQSAVTSRTNCGSFSVTSNTTSTGVTRTCTATSAGGTTSKSVTIKRDNTAPTVAWASHPSSYTVDQTVTINCTATDAHSGIDPARNCQPINAPAYTFPIGSNTRTTGATDLAGNTKSGVATSFTVKVTSTSLCNLTRQFVRSSAKYQGSTNSQRAAIDLVINAGCVALNNRQIAVYKTGLTAAANGGWLTAGQATILRSLADKL